MADTAHSYKKTCRSVSVCPVRVHHPRLTDYMLVVVSISKFSYIALILWKMWNAQHPNTAVAKTGHPIRVGECWMVGAQTGGVRWSW